METVEKVYFMPGDVVILKQDVPNKPKMIVIKKKTKMIKSENDESNFLQGIECFWFTSDGHIQTSVFNTKDLIKL